MKYFVFFGWRDSNGSAVIEDSYLADTEEEAKRIYNNTEDASLKGWYELQDYFEETYQEPEEDPVWADSDALASAGMGTDEDYGGGHEQL